MTKQVEKKRNTYKAGTGAAMRLFAMLFSILLLFTGCGNKLPDAPELQEPLPSALP